jgi:hypothetical protein
MKIIGIICATLLLLLSSALRAEPVPEDMLDHDYTACMGGETATTDSERNAYCNCVRDQMRTWDTDAYASLAMEQSRAQTGDQIPQKITDMAKYCIAKVLK